METKSTAVTVVIPMSGIGKRFLDAGYTDPKPLIQVEGKPIIAHIIDLFPKDTRFIFICNDEHLRSTSLRQMLQHYAQHATILSIPPHKLGPVFAVSQVFDAIPDDEEIIINYCDFSKAWNYADFLSTVRRLKADGAITAYKGFHPHMAGSTHYAFIKEKNLWLQQIKEKEPFTQNRNEEFASDGTYYFRSGALMKKAFTAQQQKNHHTNGEFYVSLAFNELVEQGYQVRIFEIDHMLQWGTPQDLEEYLVWSRFFLNAEEDFQPPHLGSESITLMPMAGKGERFAKEGYATSKPLLPVQQKPMVIQALSELPQTQRTQVVALSSIKDTPLHAFLHQKGDITFLDSVTNGQATTCAEGLSGLPSHFKLIIGACDNGLRYKAQQFLELTQDDTVDAIIFTFKHHPSSKKNPHMYGWVQATEQNTALSVSVKTPVSNSPENDHAIVGAFYFRTVGLFFEAYQRLIDTKTTINQEYYVDSCMQMLIDLGKTVKVFEVDHYICWGTPTDYETYRYWDAFFSRKKQS